MIFYQERLFPLPSLSKDERNPYIHGFDLHGDAAELAGFAYHEFGSIRENGRAYQETINQGPVYAIDLKTARQDLEYALQTWEPKFGISEIRRTVNKFLMYRNS